MTQASVPTTEATLFSQHRSLLWKLCYRMTGSAADAEDVVQETFVRFLEKPPQDQGRDVKPWLVQVAVNLSRDHLRRRKHRSYVGPWLPSPIETEGFSRNVQPEARYSELESVTVAFLVALEALSSSQRAVLLLRDVLGYSVAEAAHALDMTEANVKTTHHRARAVLDDYDRTRVMVTPRVQRQTSAALNRFMVLLMLGDTDALEEMLTSDAVALNDGAGEFHAARKPITGTDRILTFHRKVQREIPPLFAVREINGLPAVVGEFTTPWKGAADRFVFSLGLDANGKVAQLNTVVATDKLTHMRFEFL